MCTGERADVVTEDIVVPTVVEEVKSIPDLPELSSSDVPAVEAPGVNVHVKEHLHEPKGERPRMANEGLAVVRDFFELTSNSETS